MVMVSGADGAAEMTVVMLGRGRGPGAWPGLGGGLGTKRNVVSGPERGVVTSATGDTSGRTGTSLGVH